MFKLGCVQVTVQLSSNELLLSVGDVRQSDGCWKAVGGSRKLDGQMCPVSTGFPLCSSQLYIAVGVSAACLSARSSGVKERRVF